MSLGHLNTGGWLRPSGWVTLRISAVLFLVWTLRLSVVVLGSRPLSNFLELLVSLLLTLLLVEAVAARAKRLAVEVWISLEATFPLFLLLLTLADLLELTRIGL